MTEKQAVSSVKAFREQLARSRLLSAEERLRLEQHWRQESPQQPNLGEFTRWLTDKRYLTEFQVSMLLHGQAERLHLGPYKLLEGIGRGRVAMVYKGVDPAGRVVAIKVVATNKIRSLEMLASLQDEALRAQTLSHPNMVQTLAIGEQRGLHYLVLEYLEGETLAATLKSSLSMPVVQAINIIRQGLLGLQHLHDQGLVHGNLEPGNLMLIRQGESVIMKLLDSALGRAMPDESVGETNRYRAPERVGNAHPADIRADIYSLGCLLYHALAGQPPGPENGGSSPTSPRPLRDLADVPEALENIVSRMMAFHPTQRYPTPDRAASALQAYLGGASEPSPEESPWYLAPPPLPAPMNDQTAGTERWSLPPVSDSEVQPATDTSAGGEAATFATPDQEGLAFAALLGTSGAVVAPGFGGGQRRSPLERPRLGRRDYLLLLVGAGGLLLAEIIGWVFGRIAQQWTAARNKERKPADRMP